MGSKQVKEHCVKGQSLRRILWCDSLSPWPGSCALPANGAVTLPSLLMEMRRLAQASVATPWPFNSLFHFCSVKTNNASAGRGFSQTC